MDKPRAQASDPDIRFLDQDELVFAHPQLGKPIDKAQLLVRFKKALKRAKVREVRFHDLRHTFGTRMASAGVPLRTLQEWLGHADYKTTAIYADYAPSAHESECVERAFGRHQFRHQSEQNSEEPREPQTA